MILGVFASPERAKNVRLTLRQSERRRLIGIAGLALIERGHDGRLELLESRRASDWIEEGSGPYVSILRLMCGSSPGDPGCSRLLELADAMPPATSAIAALIEHHWVEDVTALIQEAGEETASATVRSEIGAALAAGRDLVLTAGAADWRAGPPPGSS
jgi:hypothetical protein